MRKRLVDIPFSNRGVCIQTLHVILMIITFPGSGLITLALALDRCLAVYVPLRYLSFSRGYAVLISSLGYSLALPVFVYALIRTYGNPDYGNVQVFQSFHACNSEILDTGNMRFYWHYISYDKRNRAGDKSFFNSNRSAPIHSDNYKTSTGKHFRKSCC
jgi:hypothetical protein